MFELIVFCFQYMNFAFKYAGKIYSKSRNILPFSIQSESSEMEKQVPQKRSMRIYSQQMRCFCESTPEKFPVSFYSLKFENSDASIIVETRDMYFVPLYSTLLAAISPIMFQTFLTSKNKEVKLDISRSMLKLIMDLGYSGSCNIEDEDFDEVLSTAHQYKILPLGNICGETVMSNLTHQNALDSYRKSSKFLCEHYTNRVKKFILRQFPDIVRLDSFKVKIHYFLILESEELLT